MAQTYQNFLINKTSSELEQEFETKLIRTVYSLRLLYDSSHPDFNNLGKNKLSWARVAHTCQKPYSECTKKWDSLLQTYFSSTSNNWIHHEDLKKFEPHLHNNFRIPNQFNPSNKPSEVQKEELLNNLIANSSKLLSNGTTLVERQNIWSTITFRCNAIQPGAYMGALEWKKYWYDMKQNFGIQRFMLTSKLKAMGTKLDVSKYTDDDMKILKICGVSMDDTVAVIAKALGRNLELGFNTELIIPKCLRCIKQRNELIIDGYCETCRNLPSCDLCHVVCENNTVKYRITPWSEQAKNLLPEKLSSVNEISLCVECSRELRRKATSEWKACRVCESEQPNLEFLYGNNNNILRKGFTAATTFTFNETDGLPGYICKACKIQIQQLNNFYTKFSRTQLKLKSIHSNYFIGRRCERIVNNEGQVVYLDGTKKVNNNKVTVLPSDGESMQSEPIENVLPTTVAIPPSTSISISSITTSQAATIAQPNCFPTYKIATVKPAPALSKLKRVTLQKPGTEAAVATTNANQGGGVRKKVIPTNPPLAIKEIFSLQPSAQKPKIITKPSIKVIPTAALQQAKLHGVFSNDTVTVTRKTIDLPPDAPTYPAINSKQTINIVNLANGNSVALPATNNLTPSNRGFTITKRVAVTPVQSETNNILTKQKEFIKILPKSGPPNSISPKASTTSKPAIFTISDYETIEDAPPVFCIPKKNLPDNNNIAETEAEKQLKNFNPSNAPVIKTEALEHEEYPNEETNIETNVVENPEPPTKNVTELPPSLPNETEPYTGAGVKIIRLNGSMVAVKPHPYIAGAFIPVDLNSPADLPADRLSSYIRKVDTGQKYQVETTKNHPHMSDGTLPMFPRKQQSTITNPKQNLPIPQTTIDDTPHQLPSMVLTPQYNQPISELNSLMTPEQVEQFIQANQLHEKQQQFHQPKEHQQQQQLEQQQQQLQQQQLQQQQLQQQQLQQQQQQQEQQQQRQQLQQQQQQQMQQQQQQMQQYQQRQLELLMWQQGIKKPRKYWGTVDEFNVAPLPPTKPLLPPPSFSQPMATIQQPNEIPQQPKPQTSTTPWIEERKTPALTEDPLNVQSSSNVKIKQEVTDNDVDEVSIVKNLTSVDTTPAMFYPDSFELENLNFAADVSLMINDMMIQQNSIIDTNMDGRNFDKYINPAFPISYGNKTPNDEVKNKEKEMQSKKERESKKENDSKEEAEADTRKKQEQENEDEKNKKGDKIKQNDPESTPTCMKMKNLCIKLKRDKEPIFTSRPKRLCTLHGQTRSSPSSSSSPTVATRKSLRLNQT